MTAAPMMVLSAYRADGAPVPRLRLHPIPHERAPVPNGLRAALVGLVAAAEAALRVPLAGLPATPPPDAAPELRGQT
jgi:hypothetical protein